MINVTEQLKTESISNRNYYVTANATLADGTKLTLEKKDFYLAGNGIVDSADSGDFPVGVAIEKTATLSLVNDDGRFDAYNFNKARFTIFLNLQLSDRLEKIKRGTFIVSKKPGTAEKINLTLLDRMHDADKAYDSNLSFPCRAIDVLLDACQQCGITLGDVSFPNSDFRVQKAPSNTTFRAVIGMCAALAGGNARIDENDALRVITFNKSPSTTDRHNLSYIRELQYDFDEIEVTGVSYTEDETKYISGEEGYVISLDDCQLLSGNVEQGITLIGEQLIGLKMRPFSCRGLANGYATFSDSVAFTDIKGRVFQSYTTDIEFVFGGSTQWGCNAKSAEEDTSEYSNSGAQAAVDQARKYVEKKMSAYEVKLKQMNNLAANTLGFYYTEEIQADGSVITYRHDKPTAEDSKIIYKTGADGFFLSVDGGETWKSGFDSNGDAVLNILYAIGIQSEWINTRGLTAKDNNGGVTFRIDADTGDVFANVSSLTIKGKTVKEIVTDDLTQQQIYNILTNDGQNQGIYIKDGRIYIDGEYIKSDSISADALNVTDLSAFDATIGGFSITDSGLSVVTSGGYTFLISSANKRLNIADGTSIQITHRNVNRERIVLGGPTTAALLGNVDCAEITSDRLNTGSVTASAASKFSGGLIANTLNVSGSKSRIFNTQSYGVQQQYCYEMPTPFFGDIGSSVISDDGTCIVDVDDIFQESVNANINYYVFLQKEGEGDCYIEEKYATHFTVKGTPGLKFSFELKARQLEFEHMRFRDDAYVRYETESDYKDLDYESILLKEMEQTIERMSEI